MTNNLFLNYYNNLADQFVEKLYSCSVDNPQPFRLTMIKLRDNCQFCSEPTGDSFIFEVSKADMFGFISCKKCIDIADKAYKNWFDNKAYGDVNYLKDKKIKVRRSSGDIEDDWELSKQSTLVQNGYLVCVNHRLDIHKSIKIDELMELNPKQ